jgi:hypothetical protein
MHQQKRNIRRLVAWLEQGPKRWLFVRKATRLLGHKTHKKIREKIITEKIGIDSKPKALAGMQRRVEIWRPVQNLTQEEMKNEFSLAKINGNQTALIDVDEKLLTLDDLVVDAGLNALCGQAFDGSGSRPAVFNYVAIGTDGTAPASSQTALLAQVMTRIQGTYAKDAGVGECSMDATFNIDGTYALQECGLFNASSGGTMFCRDTYTTKNVVSGDTIKVYYTPKFQVP